MSTCLVIMNREGVAIAADSAVTIGSINIVNTADKIVQLQNFSHAAVVVAGTAEYMNLPIKTVIQMFDKYLQNKKISVLSMKELNDLFINFLAENPFLDFETQRFIRIQLRFYFDQVFEKGFSMETLKKYQDLLKEPSDPKRVKQIRNVIQKKHMDVVRNVIDHYKLELIPEEQFELEKFLINVFCFGEDYTEGADIVFAGYGKDSLTPSMYKIYLYGQIGPIVFYEELKEASIDVDTSLSVTPMAQDEMIDLMQDGIVISRLREMIQGRLSKMIDFFKADSGDSPLKDYEFLSFLEAESDKIHRHIETEAIELTERNWLPLYRGLKSQTIDSLAHYVEVLISISILASKYNRDGELFQTVGGPVDVATITLIEGFQWRKYKGHHGQI